MHARDLLSLYRMMLRIRLFEERIITLYPRQEMKTPVHLYVGQEAIAAGVCYWLAREDYVFSTHRCHGHVIAKGMGLNAIMAEFYGRKAGCCGGKGGSMHLSDPALGIPATSAIVGGGIALAVGAALGMKFKKSPHLTVVFFGDGAMDEGIFFESMNFAALKKLPVLFVCENNFYATNSPQHARQPLDNIYRRGEIFGVKGFRCDGNDVMAVAALASRLIKKIRKGSGPYLMECRTYRWKGHVGPDCDTEKGCRPRYELETWIKKCPIKMFEKGLLRRQVLTRKKIELWRMEILQEIVEAENFAKSSPFPEPADTVRNVYWKEEPCLGPK